MLNITKHLIYYCSIASIGGLIYGWEVGMLNIIYSMKSSYGLRFGLYKFNDKHELVPTESKSTKESIITPVFTFGCVFGSLIAMYLMDKFGRTVPLIISSFIYTIGCITQTFANTVVVFCIGRIIAGIACGVSMVVSPVYISEITPKDTRGSMGMVYSVILQGGILLASLCDTLALKFIKGEIQWRMAVGAQLIPAVIFMLVVWFGPETPRYLLMKKKEEKALSILSKIREKPEDSKEVTSEFYDMKNKLQLDLATGIISWKELFTSKPLLYRLMIGSILQCLHMLVGANVLNYYSSQIFGNYLGIDIPKYGAWLVVISNLIVFILTFPSVRYVEKAGRRNLLLFGAFILGISMFAIFILCAILSKYSKSSIFAVLCVLFIYLYQSIFSCTWASAVGVWISEVFPLSARSKANAICIMFQYLGSALVSSTASLILKKIEYYTFLIYMGFCIIAFVFTYLFIKETRGLTLEDTAHLYKFDKPLENNKTDIQTKQNLEC